VLCEYPRLQDLVDSVVDCRYAQCLALVDEYVKDLVYDPLIGHRAHAIGRCARMRCLIDYCNAFREVPLQRIARDLGYSNVEALEPDLEAAIQGKILLPGGAEEKLFTCVNGRIDLQAGVLRAVEADSREKMREMLEVACGPTGLAANLQRAASEFNLRQTPPKNDTFGESLESRTRSPSTERRHDDDVGEVDPDVSMGEDNSPSPVAQANDAAESVAAAASPLEPCPVTSFPVLSAVLAGSADADDSGDSPTVPTNGERKSSAPKRKPASRRKSSPRKNCVTPSRNEFDYCCEVACLLVSWVGDGSWSETSKCIITALHEGGRVIMASAADDAEACACIVGSGVTERVLNSLRSLQQHGVLAVRAVNLDNNKVKFELGIAPGFVAEGRRGARRIADSLTSARRRELGTVLDWAAATRREPPVGTDLEVGTEEFLAAVKPPGECPLDEAVPLSGEDRLACTLLDFQRHTVAWMHQAEARPSDQR
ncbi:hypothetical protein FOZ63_003471, partial [Perkinsus olseni]